MSDTLCNSGQPVRQNGCDIGLSNCLFSGLRSVGESNVAFQDNGKGGAVFTDRSSTSGWGCTSEWYFRIYFTNVRFENCYARVRGGAVDIIAQAEDINETSFVNCSSGVSGGAAYIQAVGFAYDQPVGLGWINLRGILLEFCSSGNSPLLLNSTIHDTLPNAGGTIARYDRDQDVVLSVFNATANRAATFASAVYFFEQKIILLQYARFVGNTGENLVRIGPTVDNSDPLTCTFFLNNTILGGDVVRGIVYSEYTYTIETALFFGNNATWYFVVMPNRTWDVCNQTCTSGAYNGVTCTTSCVVQSATNNFTLKNCIFDTIGILEGPIHLIDCITSYQGDDIPDPCNFIVPSARSRTSRMTPKPSVSKSPTPTASISIPATASVSIPATASVSIPATASVSIPATASVSIPATVSVSIPATASVSIPATASVSIPATASLLVPPTASATPKFSDSKHFQATPLFAASETFKVSIIASGVFYSSRKFNSSDVFIPILPVTGNEAKGNAAPIAGAVAGSVAGALVVAGLIALVMLLKKSKVDVGLLDDEECPGGDTLEDLTVEDNEEPEDYVSEYGLSGDHQPSDPENGKDHSAGQPSDQLESEDRYVSERQSGSDHGSASPGPDEN